MSTEILTPSADYFVAKMSEIGNRECEITVTNPEMNNTLPSHHCTGILSELNELVIFGSKMFPG